MKAPLWTRFWARRCLLHWKWLTYLRNIILQGYFQMYPDSFGKSPISGPPRFSTGAPRYLWRVVKSTARWTQTIGGGIHRINFLLERRLCQSYLHQGRLAWPIFGVTRMPGHFHSLLVIFETISGAHLKDAPGFMLGWSHLARQVS